MSNVCNQQMNVMFQKNLIKQAAISSLIMDFTFDVALLLKMMIISASTKERE